MEQTLITKSDKILIACEYSGVVRDAFIAAGYNAISCDLLPTESPGPHLQCDVTSILYDDWDAIIAHPDCTYMCNSGVRWLHDPRFPDRIKKTENAARFFMLFYNHPCKKVVIENPIPHKYAKLPKYSQIVQPHHFGDPFTKATCLWIKGLPLLTRTHIVEKCYIHAQCHKMPPGKDRGKKRSKTYPGFARAMVNQWTS